MATKPTKNPPKNDGWQPKGFVNLYLTESQLEHAFKVYADFTLTEAAWTGEMLNGYRFTFSHDLRSQACVCTVNCKDERSENYGWLLSSFAPTWSEALALSLYKHIQVLDRVWGDNETKAPRASYG